ncbi:MAG: hypothetical protein AAF821_09875 [Cyanobacteria bacterium P01_D01_bin.156]
MKFCDNNSKQDSLIGLPFTGTGHSEKRPGYGRLIQPLAWGLPFIGVLASASAAMAQVNTTLNWNDVDFPSGTTTNTYTDLQGNGVDVRISVTGADLSVGNNPDNTLTDSNFVSPSPADTETLFVPIDDGNPATVTIEFIETSTGNPITVPLTEFQLFDVDVLFNTSNEVRWQDQVTLTGFVGGVGGTAVGGLTAGGETSPEGDFNQENPGNNSVVITGAGVGDDPNNPTRNANSPRQPALATPTTVGNFEEGNVQVNFSNPVDTITLVLANGPGTDFNDRHAIAIGNIAFQAPNVATPAIGIAKEVSAGPTETAPGSGIFTLTYDLTIENLGNEDLDTVQVVEDFIDPLTNNPTFGDGNITDFTVGTVTGSGAASIVLNAGYDITNDSNLLDAGASTLAEDTSATIPITITVDSTQLDFPDDTDNDGFNNQATTSGVGVTSQTQVDDESDNGTDPDPDDDGNPNEQTDPPGDNPDGPNNENDPTPVFFPTAPAIGIAKSVSDGPTETAPGSGIFNLTYELVIENLGGEDLETVQVVEDFIDPLTNNPTFGDGNITAFNVGGVTETNGASITLNGNYDIDNDSNLLDASTSTLPQGASATIPITITVDSNQPDFPDDTDDDGFNNQATTSGVGTTSQTPVDDDSDNGTDPDPDGDGNPDEDGENDPTPVVFPTGPAIGIAKQISGDATETSPGSGIFNLTYELVIENLGNEDLDNVQVVEDFIDPLTNNPTFGDGNITSFSLGTILENNGAAITLNGGYNITNDSNLLDATASTLPQGASATIPITITVDSNQPDFPDDTDGDGFNNQATTSGIGTTSQTQVDDASDNGTDPDPDGDGNPNEVGENDPTPVFLGPDLRLIKRITDVTRNGNSLNIPNIDGFNDDGDTANGSDTLLNDRSGGTLPVGVTDVELNLQSGDRVEYTIYFWNAGVGTAENVEICDELQVPSVLDRSSLELAGPIALSTAGTVLDDSDFGPDSQLSARQPQSPLADSCISAPGEFPADIPARRSEDGGAGGGVVLGGPNSNFDVESNQVGAFRFFITIP